MKAIYLASVNAYAGKNTVCAGLASRLARMGKKVGYFKPYGVLPVLHQGVLTDSDALFFKKALGLQDSLQDICPVVVDSASAASIFSGAGLNAKERILKGFEAVAKGKDAVLCAGLGGLAAGLAAGFAVPEIVAATGASVLMIDSFHWVMESIDGILHARQALGASLAGVVFNRVSDGAAAQVKNGAVPFLERQGVSVFGVIPADPILSAVPAREIVSALNGRVLTTTASLDELIEGFTIGAMHVQAAQQFFIHCAQRAVITGGDRADIQAAAIESRVKCLILTGGLYPSERILVRADEAGIPVILVNQDTATAISACEILAHHLTLNSERKLRRAQELCDANVDCSRLFSALGIS